jgi:hypothetical protein
MAPIRTCGLGFPGPSTRVVSAWYDRLMDCQAEGMQRSIPTVPKGESRQEASALSQLKIGVGETSATVDDTGNKEAPHDQEVHCPADG